MKYFVVTFGCAANVADSQRIAGYYRNRGWRKAKSPETADEVVIVTCMVRQSAEDRVVGLVNNLRKEKEKGKRFRIIITGCMTGMAIRDKSGKLLKILKKRMPDVDEFTSIEEIGFSHPQIRTDKRHALVSISNGCNNFCSYCVVPYSRGREVSRSFEEIIKECKELAKSGYTYITLLGQNVNSYGSDFLTEKLKTPGRWPDGLLPGEKKITYVKHLGKMRIPTLSIRGIFPMILLM
ncbi:MAG: (dimethylallyl)adenosine tRNA methylthiotransferase, bifunctional enzyme involved in thiolation and methylation of tRNA [Microgenomates group bacterium GW2011_GWC1_43_11]|nr:MAG: (dimethylallyl)adenosine tRNA methylthiotransferase, bifunctional enzyme involved in thiolation and methylation of tRNA [Microgenomates group bacterium GW2011_GWC1_43_11]